MQATIKLYGRPVFEALLKAGDIIVTQNNHAEWGAFKRQNGDLETYYFRLSCLPPEFRSPGKKFWILSKPSTYEAIITDEDPSLSQQPGTTPTSGGTHMTGKVYKGYVVQTVTVAAGEGVATGKEISKVVFAVDEPFVAASDEVAKAVVTAKAVVGLGAKFDWADPVKPVEIKLASIS